MLFYNNIYHTSLELYLFIDLAISKIFLSTYLFISPLITLSFTHLLINPHILYKTKVYIHLPIHINFYLFIAIKRPARLLNLKPFRAIM
jgi:hypothetical protein